MQGLVEIDIAALKTLQAEGSLILVDVRNSMEVAQGMIGNATHIPLHLLPLREQELDREVPTVFYCRSGARSAQACAFMLARGHRKVYNLGGGIMAWLKSGEALAA